MLSHPPDVCDESTKLPRSRQLVCERVRRRLHPTTHQERYIGGAKPGAPRLSMVVVISVGLSGHSGVGKEVWWP
ncbi:hypothetical protein BD410DRAFT_791355 [Rickenella mellea]|uniref:Uncharacterized protein n=1 Tax=Rickenella mellea TaxID=50990 RepID=A0A4Y7Q036_9AGAM|nr:hypothetical protein BD410DRAFT_791355 [Rickenella mellea]